VPEQLRRPAVVSLFAGLALVTSVWTVSLFMRAWQQDEFADDFATSVWRSGRALLAGDDPVRHYSGATHDGGSVYPPIANLVTLPFALPPYEVARAIWIVALAVSVLGALWLCGVRDWRCYLAAGASPPVVSGLAYANVSLLLVGLVAVVWQWRDHARRAGMLLGLVLAMKLFLWPLAVWLLITRRIRAFVVTWAALAGFSLIGWAAIGFHDITEYPAMLRRHAHEQGPDGVSVAALAANLNLPGEVLIASLAGLGAIAIAWRLRRTSLAAFSWCLSAALLASPIVWWHYFALLLVPLAIAIPRWSWSWLMPYLLFPQALDMVAGIVVALFVPLRVSVEEDRLLREDRPSCDHDFTSPISPRRVLWRQL
jgi:alpha-1,2-mannosyltransferase